MLRFKTLKNVKRLSVSPPSHKQEATLASLIHCRQISQLVAACYFYTPYTLYDMNQFCSETMLLTPRTGATHSRDVHNSISIFPTLFHHFAAAVFSHPSFKIGTFCQQL
ncbi:hypothetical protein KC342_g66 [Hortaea werneckii]|nr:hypothetical protein KC342_g66 [Hortaea werneckii]